MNSYQVIVSNVGTVYDGANKVEANKAYAAYKADSVNAIGRAAGEDVTLMMDGEPYQEFIGALSEHHSAIDAAEQAQVDTPCDCPSCTLRGVLAGAVGKALDKRKAQAIQETEKAATGVTHHTSYAEAVCALALHNAANGDGSFNLVYISDIDCAAQATHPPYDHSDNLDIIKQHSAFATMGADTILHDAVNCGLGGEVDGGYIYIYGELKVYTETNFFVIYP